MDRRFISAIVSAISLVAFFRSNGTLSAACTATQKNWGASDVTFWPNGPATSNTVSTTATVNAVGDLVAITAWCFPINTFTGGCTPTGVTLGNQAATQTTMSMDPDPGTSGTPGSGQGFLYYILSAAASGSQTLTFTIKEDEQMQVAWMDFGTSAGCSFSHDLDSPLASGNNVGTRIISPSLIPTAGEVLFNFTITSGHMVDPVGSPWVASIWPGSLSHFLNNSVNLVAYDLSSSGTVSNNANTLHASDSWQALLTSFQMATTPAPPTGLQATAH